MLDNLDHVFQDYGHFAAAADSQPHMDGEMISQTGLTWPYHIEFKPSRSKNGLGTQVSWCCGPVSSALASFGSCTPAAIEMGEREVFRRGPAPEARRLETLRTRRGESEKGRKCSRYAKERPWRA